MSRGWGLGGAEFKREMRREAAQRGADLERSAGLEPEEVARERDHAWGERLTAFAHAARIDLSGLPPRKSDPTKALLAAAMKQRTSVSNRWLGERLKMGPPASASQFARRYLRTEAGRKEIERLLSRVKT